MAVAAVLEVAVPPASALAHRRVFSQPALDALGPGPRAGFAAMGALVTLMLAGLLAMVFYFRWRARPLKEPKGLGKRTYVPRRSGVRKGGDGVAGTIRDWWKDDAGGES
ncbi:MAG: hypothetical protein H7A53_09375 [Akkermansiaceae bacterium]|nr:hypothetical protein [Akkermansiaceae bacterium]